MIKSNLVRLVVVCTIIASVFCFSVIAFAEKSSDDLFKPDKTAKVAIAKVTEWYQAVGTVRPKTETNIQAQIRAQVKKVHVTANSKVSLNQLLISLDDRQLKSKHEQARQALKVAKAVERQAKQGIISAKAKYLKAESNYQRKKKLFKSNVATSKDIENAEAEFIQAKAVVSSSKDALAAAKSSIKKTREVVREAKIALGYTSITAPGNGKILRRLVEKGDIAIPGKSLIVLQTSGYLRLEAYVREGLIEKISQSTILKVKIDSLKKVVEVKIDEIVPYADPKTRTFLVKTSLPEIKDLYPGMFGKLLVPVNVVDAVVVPQKAVNKVGQLNLVSVKEGDTWSRRYIKVGKKIGTGVEVLSGLSGGETVGWREQ